MKFGLDATRDTQKHITTCVYNIDFHEVKETILPLQKKGR